MIWIVRTLRPRTPAPDEIFADDILAIFNTRAEADQFAHDLLLPRDGPGRLLIKGYELS